jgi:hypothetical protein
MVDCCEAPDDTAKFLSRGGELPKHYVRPGDQFSAASIIVSAIHAEDGHPSMLELRGKFAGEELL